MKIFNLNTKSIFELLSFKNIYKVIGSSSIAFPENLSTCGLKEGIKAV